MQPHEVFTKSLDCCSLKYQEIPGLGLYQAHLLHNETGLVLMIGSPGATKTDARNNLNQFLLVQAIAILKSKLDTIKWLIARHRVYVSKSGIVLGRSNKSFPIYNGNGFRFIKKIAREILNNN